MDAILDLRCLQDPAAGPGAGCIALDALRFAPRTRLVRLTGLLDPALPLLDPGVRSMLHGVRHTAYTGALTQPTCLVSFSPMAHDPLFTARLLHHPDVLGVAVVEALLLPNDLDRLLPDAEARLDYHVSLRWLARNRLFLASPEAGEALRHTLGVRPDEIVPAGVDAAHRLWDAVLSRMGPRRAPFVQRGARPSLAVVLSGAAPDAAYGRALCKAMSGLATVTMDGGMDHPPSPLPFLSSGHDRVLAFGDVGLAARRHLVRYGAAWLGDLNGALPDAELRRVAEPVLLHSPAALRASGEALHLPYGCARAWPPGALAAPARHAARARLHSAGLPVPVLAVFSGRATGDALQDCVWALDLLRGWGVEARLHILSGQPAPDATHMQLAVSLGLGAQVWAGGADAVQDHLLAADLALEVRAGVTHEAPVALVDCLAAGLRCVASASLVEAAGVEAAGAPPHAHAVPDHLSPVRLAEAVLHALDQPPVAEAERRAYADERSMGRTAIRLLRLLGLQA